LVLGVNLVKGKVVTVAVKGALNSVHISQIRYIRDSSKMDDKFIVILIREDSLNILGKMFLYLIRERIEMLEKAKGIVEVITAMDQVPSICKPWNQ
jgi:glycerol-3-phosphate cytidylyltransferase-like family protein